MANRNPYRAAADVLLAESGCTVRGWRKDYSGKAWTKSADWGIASPEPRGTISFAIFAHEVAHQMLHRGGSKPQWLEEIEAWQWALDQYERFGLADPPYGWASDALAYSLQKSRRRAKKPETLAAIDAAVPSWFIPKEEAA